MAKSKTLQYLEQRSQQINKALNRYLPQGNGLTSASLNEAMRYSIFSGGKRVRPFLVLESHRLCGGKDSQAMALACAVEMVHAYSLVHDDLPAMDDDEFRRGKPTCHKKFNEATAILTGDALLTLAFQTIAEAGSSNKRVQQVIQVLSHAAGPYGMVAGQAEDLIFQHNPKQSMKLEKINELKTGALITASTQVGALWAGANVNRVKRLKAYGENVGFLFQLIDDIIDGDGYAAVLGVDETYRLAKDTMNQAKENLSYFGHKAKRLIDFAEYLYIRKK